jgi:hypothetical protein
MEKIYYNDEGYILGLPPFYSKVSKRHELEIPDDVFEKIHITGPYYCWKVVDGEIKYVIHDKSGYELSTNREAARKELTDLTSWFNNVYDVQVKQYERCLRLGVEYDNKYGTIAELDALASQNAKRINELNTLLTT